MRQIGPGSLEPNALLAVLRELQDAVRGLQTPQGPVLAWTGATADLPPAADYQNRTAVVTDVPAWAYSNGTNWLNLADGSTIA